MYVRFTTAPQYRFPFYNQHLMLSVLQNLHTHTHTLPLSLPDQIWVNLQSLKRFL